MDDFAGEAEVGVVGIEATGMSIISIVIITMDRTWKRIPSIMVEVVDEVEAAGEDGVEVGETAETRWWRQLIPVARAYPTVPITPGAVLFHLDLHLWCLLVILLATVIHIIAGRRLRGPRILPPRRLHPPL